MKRYRDVDYEVLVFRSLDGPARGTVVWHPETGHVTKTTVDLVNLETTHGPPLPPSIRDSLSRNAKAIRDLWQNENE